MYWKRLQTFAYPVNCQCLETIRLWACSLHVTLVTRSMIIDVCMPIWAWRRGLLIISRSSSCYCCRWGGLTKCLCRCCWVTMVTTHYGQHGVLYCHRWKSKGNISLLFQESGKAWSEDFHICQILMNVIFFPSYRLSTYLRKISIWSFLKLGLNLLPRT